MYYLPFLMHSFWSVCFRNGPFVLTFFCVVFTVDTYPTRLTLPISINKRRKMKRHKRFTRD